MLKKILISGLMIFAVPAFAVTLEFDDAQSGPGPFQDPGTFFESGFTVNGYYFSQLIRPLGHSAPGASRLLRPSTAKPR